MDKVTPPLGPAAHWVGSGDGVLNLIFVKSASKSYTSVDKEKYDHDDDEEEEDFFYRHLLSNVEIIQ